MRMLMEATPVEIEVNALKIQLAAVTGVKEVHDLHVWSLSDAKFAMTAHLVVPSDVNQSIG